VINLRGKVKTFMNPWGVHVCSKQTITYHRRKKALGSFFSPAHTLRFNNHGGGEFYCRLRIWPDEDWAGARSWQKLIISINASIKMLSASSRRRQLFQCVWCEWGKASEGSTPGITGVSRNISLSVATICSGGRKDGVGRKHKMLRLSPWKALNLSSV
jgi:hypothetical protein